jgi:hypothetical protein
MKKLLFAAALLTFISFLPAGSIFAQGNPVQLALFNPVQIVPEGNSIEGLRISLIYGKNRNVTGFDWGLVSTTTGNQVGIQWGGVGYNEGDFKGWQYNFVSYTKGNFLGLQSGFVSYNGGKVNGLQFSVFNYAATLNGVQLGLINVIGKGGFLPIFPLFNFSFDK